VPRTLQKFGINQSKWWPVSKVQCGAQELQIVMNAKKISIGYKLDMNYLGKDSNEKE
jgi:hypothetical protein